MSAAQLIEQVAEGQVTSGDKVKLTKLASSHGGHYTGHTGNSELFSFKTEDAAEAFVGDPDYPLEGEPHERHDGTWLVYVERF